MIYCFERCHSYHYLCATCGSKFIFTIGPYFENRGNSGNNFYNYLAINTLTVPKSVPIPPYFCSHRPRPRPRRSHPSHGLVIRPGNLPAWRCCQKEFALKVNPGELLRRRRIITSVAPGASNHQACTSNYLHRAEDSRGFPISNRWRPMRPRQGVGPLPLPTICVTSRKWCPPQRPMRPRVVPI